MELKKESIAITTTSGSISGAAGTAIMVTGTYTPILAGMAYQIIPAGSTPNPLVQFTTFIMGIGGGTWNFSLTLGTGTYTLIVFGCVSSGTFYASGAVSVNIT